MESSQSDEKIEKTVAEEADLPRTEESAQSVTDSLSEELKKVREEAQKELLYLRADFENTRRRLQRDQETAIKFANEKLISEFLNVTDLLDRALSYSGSLKARNDDKEAKDFVSGIEILQKELHLLLGRFGVEFIGMPGEKFDPLKHEAISQREAPHENQDSIVEVLQKGSLLNGRLLKPAKVVVAIKKA